MNDRVWLPQGLVSRYQSFLLRVNIRIPAMVYAITQAVKLKRSTTQASKMKYHVSPGPALACQSFAEGEDQDRGDGVCDHAGRETRKVDHPGQPDEIPLAVLHGHQLLHPPLCTPPTSSVMPRAFICMKVYVVTPIGNS